MNNIEWINANLEGKVKARALRACEEQPEWVSDDVKSIVDCFYWPDTKEGVNYWKAIFNKLPNPEQLLPENYLDVDHFVEPTEMVEDEFLTWLEEQIGHVTGHKLTVQMALLAVRDKYKELKTK